MARKDVFKHVAMATPYLELYDTLSFTESVEFQAGFRPFRNGLAVKEIVTLTGLPPKKPMKQFSSGKKRSTIIPILETAGTGYVVVAFNVLPMQRYSSLLIEVK